MFEVQSDKIMHDYLEKIGFTPSILEGIGTISVYAATIEFWMNNIEKDFDLVKIWQLVTFEIWMQKYFDSYKN